MTDHKHTTFFEALQNDKALDLRDNRGKRHGVAIILVEFVLGLLCNRDGKMSSIWRHMKDHHTQVVQELGLENIVKKNGIKGAFTNTIRQDK